MTENTDQQQLENAVPEESAQNIEQAQEEGEATSQPQDAPEPDGAPDDAPQEEGHTYVATGPAIEDPTGRIAPADQTEGKPEPEEADEELSVEQRRTAEARKREVIRQEAAAPVQEQINLQLREAGLA